MKALVTGGSGFLGGALVKTLCRGGAEVISLSRAATPHLAQMGAQCVEGFYGDASLMSKQLQGIDTLFHVASKVGIEGTWNDFYDANVVGTEKLLAAAREAGVGRFVYTSSPSVIFDGADHRGVDETVPYPHDKDFLAHYPRSKAMAERLVLAANGDGLRTCALRPHLIWGPGDTNLLPRLVQLSRRGRLRRVGSGGNMVDVAYIDNVVSAHLRAAERMDERPQIGGAAYFITQGEPVDCWDFIDQLLATQGEPPVRRSVPAPLAFLAGGALELIYRLLRLHGEPPMSRFVAQQLSCNHWFSIHKAERDLGYVVIVDTAEGLRRLAESSIR